MTELYDPTSIDTLPPTIAPIIKGTVVNGWYTAPVTVTLNATDDSGVKSISVQVGWPRGNLGPRCDRVI